MPITQAAFDFANKAPDAPKPGLFASGGGLSRGFKRMNAVVEEGNPNGLDVLRAGLPTAFGENDFIKLLFNILKGTEIRTGSGATFSGGGGQQQDDVGGLEAAIKEMLSRMGSAGGGGGAGSSGGGTPVTTVGGATGGAGASTNPMAALFSRGIR